MAAAAALALAGACARPAPPPAVAPPSPVPAPSALPTPAPVPPCERVLWIEVRKSERRLEAHCEGGAVVVSTVALGREPGPKRRAGDHRTPEGSYRVAGPARSGRYHRFVPIDYPSPADADLALREGRLSRADYARILAAHARDALPPQDTPLGGQLGLHGEGERWRGDSAHLDWTYGCIALGDDELDFLAARAPRGTPVRILP
jgi:murein L,D-transpeptidase YafK